MYPFPANTTISVTGTTFSGKTTWVYKLLKHKNVMFQSPPNKILYCYGVHQSLFDEMEETLPSITFHKGLPSTKLLDEYSNSPTCNIIILDDLMQSIVSNAEIEQLFTLGAHHRRLVVIYLNQNLFCKGSKSRSISLNTHFLILLKNPRDLSQIQCLSRQIYPGESKLLVEAYRDCMKTAYGYLVVDIWPASKDDTRLRTMIFPGEDTVVYQRL